MLKAILCIQNICLKTATNQTLININSYHHPLVLYNEKVMKTLNPKKKRVLLFSFFSCPSVSDQIYFNS